MKHRSQLSHWLFVLAAVFALLSITDSAAISRGRLERQVFAQISDDGGAILKLSGFDDESYDLWSKYEPIGSIGNHTGRSILLTVAIQTEFLQLQNKNTFFSVKIGSDTREFDADNTAGQIAIRMQPGETVTVEALLHPGQNTDVIASFQFKATDLEGNLDLQLPDTLRNPRRITCY